MVTVKNDAHKKQTAAKNHGVLFVENRVAFRADFRSNREALFEEELDIIFSHPLFLFSLFGDFCDVRIRLLFCFVCVCMKKKKNLEFSAEKSCFVCIKKSEECCSNVEKTPRTKREHKPGVGAHRSGRGYFESELNVRTVQEYTQRGEHGGMFFISFFKC